MQLKFDRKPIEKGVFRKRIEYELHAALYVTAEEEADLVRHGFWNKPVRPLKRQEEGNYDLETIQYYKFKDLVAGVTIFGTLSFVENIEADLLAACREAKRQLGGAVDDIIVDV